jgi:hypothetical protein
VINVLKYGIPTSISETTYLNKKYGPQLFLAWAILSSLPLMIFWLTISAGQTYQFLVFLCCASLVFVGVASKFKESLTHTVHVIGALISAVAAAAWSFIYTPLWHITLLIFALCIVCGIKVEGIDSNVSGRNSLTFFAELAAFLNVYISTFVFYEYLYSVQ